MKDHGNFHWGVAIDDEENQGKGERDENNTKDDYYKLLEDSKA